VNRHRTLVSLALSALLTFGSVGVADAAGHARGHHKSQHASHVTKAEKAAKQLATQRRIVVHDIKVKEARLARALSAESTAALPADLVAALVANRDADRAALAAWGDAAAAATTKDELAATRALVRSVRPEVYAVAVSTAQQALALEAELAALEAGIDPFTVDPAVLDLATAAHGAVSAVYGAAAMASGLAGHDSVDAAQAALELAVAAVAALAAALAPPVVEPVAEPVV
jgi:hypothetical protein